MSAKMIKMSKKLPYVVEKKSRLEIWLDYHNHEMELVRTIIPVMLIVMQTIILIKLFGT